MSPAPHILKAQPKTGHALAPSWRRWLPLGCSLLWLVSGPTGIALTNAAPTVATRSPLTSITELQAAIAENGRAIHSFRVEAVVCAVLPARRLIALQDETSAALFELPAIGENIRPGDVVLVEGTNCILTRNLWRMQLGSAPVVDNDGTHHALAKSGWVFLEAGRQPLRLMWFNSKSAASLNVEYEGPGLPRQRVPDQVLWHSSADSRRPDVAGLRFAAYEGDGWFALPDFQRPKPAAQGVAPNFDITRRTRDEDAALEFTGAIEIATAGIYTFHLESDDGSQLFVGNTQVSCTLRQLASGEAPEPKEIEAVLAAAAGGQWAVVEGRVEFVAQIEQGYELELESANERVPVVLVSTNPLLPATLLQQRVRVTGVCEATHDPERRTRVRFIVPGAAQMTTLKPTDETLAGETSTNVVLTAARQVQRLKPERARQNLRARIRGVVTQASPKSLVLQDPTGGVFVVYSADDWTEQPRVGELWEIAGTTDPGDFSPVIRATTGRFLGNAALPQPIRPAWEQLMNGSLDAQYVELEGVVTSVSESGLMLLTQDGRLRVSVDELRWSYVDGRELFVTRHDSVAAGEMRRAYLDNVVKIRGCLVPVWNEQTGQVKAGEIRMVAAVVAVEEVRPTDPFALPLRRVADLLRFDPRASAFRRTRLAGQIIHARPPEYFLLDGQTGCRVVVREPVIFAPGDTVEVVGFPRLSGSAPVLLEAEIRKTSVAPLPMPATVEAQRLLDRELDATLVQLEATLQRDSAQQDERVFELQSGQYHFIARLKTDTRSWKTLLPGSRLQLSGVLARVSEEPGARTLAPFELLLNNPGAIIVLQQGPWWTFRHTITVVAVLAAGLIMALVWIKLLRRQVEERSTQLAKEIEIRERTEQHRAMEQERTRVAQDLHDELGAGLTEMGILGSLAKNAAVPPEEKERYLDQLIDSSRSLVTGLDEIVWAINPHYDSVGSLATYYSFFAERFLNLAGIACRLRVAEALPEHPLDSRVRHGVFLAFKEALNNIVRHAAATEVELKIEVTGNELAISIHDNGRGFTPSATPGNDGLAGMRERLRQLGGTCDIRSALGEGTTVEFKLELKGASA